jgi:Peptidase family C25
MSDELIHPNGVNGLTGEFLLPPLATADVADRARKVDDDPDTVNRLKQVHADQSEATYRVPFDIDPENVANAGWAIVFSEDEDDVVKAALDALIEHRGSQVGDDRMKVLDYQPGEGWPEWLVRHGTSIGNLDPRKVPYYVLLVGGPDRIPFSFQFLLSVEYAVGRLSFDDADGYRRYVGGLIDYESAAPARDSVATFFGTRHPFDRATQLSADSLVTPLSDGFGPGGRFESAVTGYRIDTLLAEEASKAALGELLAGSGPSGRPALLFSATHGLGGWPAGHPDQAARHGALVCQGWPGVGQIATEHYFAGSDLPAEADVHGLVAFFFACFGAGTPREDAYAHMPGQPPPVLATEPFVAALPKRLLGHPNGGALAVIGHVDLAWGYSFVSDGAAQVLPFQNATGRILLGQPVGHAMKDFNERYAALSTSLSDMLERVGFAGFVVSDAELARLWTQRNDAQNYVVLGDPAAAVRID